jgi:autotransporter-associated beta strand protein
MGQVVDAGAGSTEGFRFNGNTTLTTWGVSRATPEAKMAIGGNAGGISLFNGIVGEVVVFTSILSDANRQKMEGYLANKWGIADNLPAGHPYKGQLIDTASGSLTISGILSGSQGLTKAGANTLTLSGTNTYTGKTNIIAGTLSINTLKDTSTSSALGAPTTAANGTIAIGNGTTAATLVYTGSGDTTNRVIDLAGTTGGVTIDQSGSGTLTFTSAFTATGAGAKTLTLQGSTASGGVISAAIVDSSSATALTKAGTGTWSLSGACSFTGATAVNGGTLNLGAGGTTGSLATSSSITVTSPGIFAFNRSNAVTMGTDCNSVISGTGAVTQSGSGTTTVGSTQTYTGATTINAGIFLVTGSTHASSAVAVNSGGTLKGTGTINGTITVASGGTVGPGLTGVAIGQLNVVNATLQSGSTVSVDLDGTTPTFDKINSAAGTITLAGNLTVATLTNAALGKVYTIIGAATVTGTFNGLADNATFTAATRTLRVNYTSTTVTLTDVNPVTGGRTTGLLSFFLGY